MNKSIKLNTILNVIKIVFSMIFPLITFPYASKVLGVENIGKINFSNSIVSYFLLIAGLGIASYAIREGSLYKDNREQFTSFVNEVFSINVISTIIAYFFLVIFTLFFDKIYDYRIFIAIQSLSIIFTTLGLDWINSIYEEFSYITITTIFFQFISLVLLFIFVKDINDYYWYAFITVISTVGYNFVSMFHVRKYAKFKFVFSMNLKKHLKPILIIFSTAIATTIYVNSDSTILGFICGDYETGLYSVAVKIYSIFKQLLQAIVIVTLPRLSYFIAHQMLLQYENLLKKVINVMLLFALPMCIGTICLSDQVVLLISSIDFINASTSLKILAIALIFSAFATIATTSILLPQGKEKYIFYSSVVSSILNILLNFIFIPLFKASGAAFTTLIAEMTMFILAMKFSNISFCKLINRKDIFCSITECLCITLITVILKCFIHSSLFLIILSVVISMMSYTIILFLGKNELFYNILHLIKTKVNL